MGFFLFFVVGFLAFQGTTKWRLPIHETGNILLCQDSAQELQFRPIVFLPFFHGQAPKRDFIFQGG